MLYNASKKVNLVWKDNIPPPALSQSYGDCYTAKSQKKYDEAITKNKIPPVRKTSSRM